MKTPLRILAVSGSLRAASSNTTLLRAAAALAPANMEFTFYHGLGDLPHFSPDLDGDEPPAAVREWRGLLRAADGVVVCTPEYAFGMPGSLKNAFDWIVSSGELDGGKPAAAISASPSVRGGDQAHAALVHLLGVLGAKIPEAGALIVPLVRTKLTSEGGLSDPATADALRSLLGTLAQAIQDRAV